MKRNIVIKAIAVIERLIITVAAADRALNVFRKMPANNAIIGHGEFRYRAHKNWGTPKNRDDFPVKDCHEMVMASNNRLLMLTNHPKNNILIYNLDGEIIDSWTLGFDSAHGLTLNQEDGKEYLYICDTNSASVVKTDLSGNVLMKLPMPWEIGLAVKEHEYLPTQTAVAKNGDIYIADGYGTSKIFQFDKTGKFIREFAGKGNKDDSINQAHGIAIDYRGEEPTILVTSRADCCFKRFSMNGEYLATINIPGAFVCRPVIHKDNLYSGACWSNILYMANTGFVTILDKQDKVVSNPGGSAPVYDGEKLNKLHQDQKVFGHCHDVCLDHNDNIYVCQWNSNGVYPVKLERIIEQDAAAAC